MRCDCIALHHSLAKVACLLPKTTGNTTLGSAITACMQLNSKAPTSLSPLPPNCNNHSCIPSHPSIAYQVKAIHRHELTPDTTKNLKRENEEKTTREKKGATLVGCPVFSLSLFVYFVLLHSTSLLQCHAMIQYGLVSGRVIYHLSSPICPAFYDILHEFPYYYLPRETE